MIHMHKKHCLYTGFYSKIASSLTLHYIISQTSLQTEIMSVVNV